MMILGTMVTGMTLGTGIRTKIHFGNLRNLQALALRELWSNLRVARPRQVRLCSDPPQGSVSAVSAVNSRQSSTFEKGKAPTAKSSSMANVALFAAAMMCAVSRGASLCVPTFGQNTGEDMFTGLVDFCPSRGYPMFDRLSKKACISPVVTFMNETVREKKDTLFSVENLGISLNTNFHDLWLAEHLLASTTLDSEQWILFDSGASANCCP